MPSFGLSADPNYRYSINHYVGDGERITWELSFAGGYIKREHVRAQVTDFDGNATAQEFSWTGDNTVVVSPPVPEGYGLTFIRDTPKTVPIADFTDGAVINEKNLDDNAKQAVFIAAEALDRGEGALNELAPRAILVPVGETAPSVPVRSKLTGRLLGVSQAGNIIGVDFTPDGIIPDSSLIVHDGLPLDGVLRQRISEIELSTQQLSEQALAITANGEDIIEQALAGTAMDGRLTTLRTEHDSLVGVVNALTDINNPEGIATLIANEEAARIDGDTALATTIGVIGAKSADNSAFILDMDRVKVGPDESIADRFSFLDAEDVDNAALIQEEQTARIAGDTAEATARTTLAAELRDETAAAILSEQTTRANADEAEATQRTNLAATLRTETGDAIRGEQDARAAAITAAVQSEATARADADTAEATARTALATTLRGETTAAVSAEASARSTAIDAEATAREQLGVTLRDETSSQIQTEATARADADGVFTQNFTLLGARNAGGTGFILNENTVLLTGGSALGTRLTGIDTAIGNANSAIADEATARANALEAEALARNTLAATLRLEAAQATLPDDFQLGDQYFQEGYGGLIQNSFMAYWSFPTVTGMGRVAQVQMPLNDAHRDISTVGLLPVLPGRTYRVTARVRITATVEPTTPVLVYLIGTNHAGSPLVTPGRGYTLSVADGWITLTHEVSADIFLNGGCTLLRPMFRFNASPTTALTGQIRLLKIEDVTETIQLGARIDTEQTTRVNALSAEATARTTLAAQLRHEAGSIDLPSSFLHQGTHWREGYAGLGLEAPLPALWSFPAVAGIGTVCQIQDPGTAVRDTCPRGAVPLIAGRRYRVTAKVRVTATTLTSAECDVYAIPLNVSGGYVSGALARVTLTVAGGWVTQSVEINADGAIAAGAAYIRPMLRANASAYSGSATWQIAFLKLEDITDAYDLSARIDVEASVRADAVGNLNARYGLTLDVNGYITGWSMNNDGTSGSMVIDVDTFKVGRYNQNLIAPFEISDGLVKIREAAIGSLTVNKLTSGQLDATIDVGSGRIVYNNGAFMKVTGVGFGTTNQFLEWAGPSMDLALCSEANAVQFLKTNGDAYFGGALSSGTLTTKATTSALSATAETDTGEFGSNGGTIIVNLSWSLTSYRFTSYPGTTAGKQEFDEAVAIWGATGNDFDGYSATGNAGGGATVYLYRSVAGGAETHVATLTVSGGSATWQGFTPVPADSAAGSSTAYNSHGGGISFTDPQTTTSNRRYRAVIITRNAGLLDNVAQRLSIIATEQ